MSTTFWIEQAPVERVVPYPEHEPDYTEIRPVEPFFEINLACGNVNAMLELISPEDVRYEDEPYGEWDMAKCAQIRQRAMVALNTRACERGMAPNEAFGNTYVRGRSHDYVRDRLERFMRLCEVAMQHGFAINFG